MAETYAGDLYRALGITPNATQEEIRSAYRRLARRLHPDTNKNPGAINQFKGVSAANSVLSDAGERRKYDEEFRSQTVKQPLTLRITTSRQTVPPIDEPQMVYVLVEVMATLKNMTPTNDVPLNLILVLDRSTSMRNDGRLDRLRMAAFQIIEQLNAEDILGIVAFSDDAEVIVPAGKLINPAAARAQIAMMQPSGGTEILKGLKTGVDQVRRYASKQYINHIILLTDGQTYDDERQSLELAGEIARRGIGISAMGLGNDWNDVFLDHLASATGGTSEYINAPSGVARFLNERVRALGQAYVERLKLSIAPDVDVKLESVFRLSPNPQAVTLDSDPIMLGSVQMGNVASTLLSLQLGPQIQRETRSLVRLEATGDLIRDQWFDYKLINDLSISVSDEPATQPVPPNVVDALNRISFYRQQEKAQAAVAKGDVAEATKRMERLATHLLKSGHEALAKEVMSEAITLKNTNMLSNDGKKSLKYGTRLLIASRSISDDQPDGSSRMTGT